MLFRTLVDLAAICFLCEFAYRQHEVNLAVLKNKWVLGGIASFLFVLLYSTLLSISPHLSFWGSYFRNQGALTLLHLLIFFLLLSTALRTTTQRDSLLKTIALSATLVSLYGLFQQFGIDFVDWNTDSLLGRAFSSFGHPNYLGQFLIITLFATLYLLFTHFHDKKWRGIWIASFLLQLITLGLTMSRASLLGFMGGLALLCVLYAHHYKKKNLLKGLGVLLGLGILFLVTAQLFHFSRFDFTNPENLRSFQTRLVLWPHTLQMIQDSPLIGYGLETFKVAFTPYFSAELLQYENINELPDRAHNEGLDLLIQTGWVGTLLFYGFFFLWIRWALTQNKPLQLVLISAVFASTLANQLGFYTITHQMILLSLLAISLTEGMPTQPFRAPPRWKYGILLGFIFIPSLVTNVHTVTADYFLQQQEWEKAKNIQPHYDEYALIYAENRLFQPETVNENIPQIVETLERVNDRNPAHYQVYIFSGYLAGLQENRDNLDANFKQAQLLAPMVAEVWITWAKSLYVIGDHPTSLEKYEHYIDLLPDDWKGEDSNKKRIFFKLNPEFKGTLETMISLYEEAGKDKKASYYREILNRI